MTQATTLSNSSSLSTSREKAAATLERRRRDELVAEHMPMVERIAAQVCHQVRGRIEREELISWGVTGLLESIDRYDASRSAASLATFSYLRVRGAMLDGIGRIAPLSRKSYRSARAAGDTQAIYRSEVETEDIPDGRERCSPVDIAVKEQSHRALRKALASLPPSERHIIEEHYFADRSLKDAGEDLGISKSWACRSHARAIHRLRETLGEFAA